MDGVLSRRIGFRPPALDLLFTGRSASAKRAPMSPLPAPRFRFLAPALVGMLAAAFAVHRIEDFDVWYHLAAGRWMSQTWRWPVVNTFAFTAPDHPWIDLHWIFQLLLYAAYEVAGLNGCMALVVVLLLATVAILYGLARRWASPAAVAFLLAVALTIASPRFVPRPEMLSFVLFAAYLWLLESYPANGRSIYWLVPLQILWVNSQGIFAVGLALVGCYWLGATIAFLPLPAGWKRASALPASAWRRLTVTLALATVGCLLNPYGVEGALFPLQLLPRVTGNSLFSMRIGEFRAPFESGYAPVLSYTWAAFMAAAGLAFLINVRRWRLGRLLAVAAFAWLSAQALRNMAFFAWIAAIGIAANCGEALRARREQGGGAGRTDRDASGRSRRFSGAPRLVEAVGLGAIAVLIGSLATNHFSRFLGIEREFGLGVSPVRFPTEAVAFADEVGITGRPFNCLAMGGYLAWTRFPAQQVFVDGRLEAFPEMVFRNYFRVIDDPKLWPQLVGRYHVDYVLLYHLWGNRLPLVTYLASGYGWKLVYYDEIASIFLPDDEEHRDFRERAERAFAERLAKRAQAPEPRPLSSLERVLHVPVAEIWRQRSYGNFLRSIGLNAEAAAAYRHVLALDPDRTDARFSLGLALWYSGEPQTAMREWREVLRREPTNENARRALADAASALQR